MPENETPSQVPVPTPGGPARAIPENQPGPSKLLTYVIAGVVLALIVTVYTYVNKYRLSEETITTLNKTITDTKTQLDQKTREFSDYKRTVESETSWVDTEYYTNGHIKHQKVFNKNVLGVSSSGTTVLTDLTSNTTTHTDATTTTKDQKRDQSGVPINGAVFISLPFETFMGKVSSLGLGIDHQFIFDTTVGLEVGSNDLTKVFDSGYARLLLGHGIP